MGKILSVVSVWIIICSPLRELQSNCSGTLSSLWFSENGVAQL